MDAVSGLFLNALGTDMVTMEEYFPFITKAFDVMQYTAWAVLFLIVVWQLFRAFGGPITEAENPWQLVVRGAIFALLIGYAKPIFMLALDIARAPYTALMDVSMTAEEFTFAGVEQALSNGLLTIVSTVTVVGPILVLILLIALGWNYFKLLLEAVERYIVVGVLCYTSPLAFCMGGSKATNQVFKSWCRMVGSQLLLLVMNVWFIRGFNSSVGQYIGNGGALSTGQGSIFLWLFCALAFLKTAQKFDSYMAAMGLNVAQTGSSMGMELLMAARVISGVGHSAKSAGSVFGRGGSTATGTGAAASGFASGFASRFKGNSYVRDAVVDGGTRMGMGGGVGFVGRVFGGVAARNGAMLTGESISSVAARPAEAAGTIAGDIADRSLGNYMPQLAGHTLKGTQISGGHISTTATGTDGKVSSVEMFNTAQFEKPAAPHSVVTATDGSTWYQMASGEGRNAFYDAPGFTGSPAESEQVAAAFPGAAEGTVLRNTGDGIMEASSESGNSLWYNSAYYDVPDAPHTVMQAANGVDWYAMRKHIITTALSLVGKVPYFWGGKSAPGWNDAWNTPRLVTSAGSPTTGTIRPFGLDCSGFTTWVFNTAVGVEIGAGCNGQYPNTYGVSAAELLPGDLGFLADDDGWGHVLIFAGYDAEGTRMWVHSSGGIGVILNTPSYEGRLSYRRLSIVDYDAPVVNAPIGEALYTLEVEVTHYCACAKCCGSNAQGLTASGKQAAVGMVAMSSHYPFGTQIMINGTMYTVEDRGGSGIENNIHRVDIYVPDHQKALRMGRYTTTATIYRLGR